MGYGEIGAAQNRLWAPPGDHKSATRPRRSMHHANDECVCRALPDGSLTLHIILRRGGDRYTYNDGDRGVALAAHRGRGLIRSRQGLGKRHSDSVRGGAGSGDGVALLAAVCLTPEAEDDAMRNDFRTRSRFRRRGGGGRCHSPRPRPCRRAASLGWIDRESSFAVRRESPR